MMRSVRIETANCISVKDSERPIFDRWIDETAKLIGELYEYGEFSPLIDNERSAVGCFLGGAVKAGFPAAIEYTIKRRDKSNRRKQNQGRADLWFVADGLSHSFEFKLYNPNGRWNKFLWDAIDDAHDDMMRVDPKEYDVSYSAVIAPEFGQDISNQIEEVIACDDTHHVYQFLVRDDVYAHIFFTRIDK